MPDRILVVEHDHPLRDSMCLYLELEGYRCESAADGDAALHAAGAARFDLIVTNLALPPDDGLHICRVLRTQESHRRVPMMIVAAPSRRADAITALEQYADDYLAMPVSMRELVARARALIRRARIRREASLSTAAPLSLPAIVRDGLVIDPARRRVHLAGHDVKLTNQEFQLLYTLAGHSGIVFERQALLSQIWGGGTFVTPRSVDALVKRVRRRLEIVDTGPEYLVTVRGVGYKFEERAIS